MPFRNTLATPTLRGLKRENKYLGREIIVEQYDFWLTEGNGRCLVTTPTLPIENARSIDEYDDEITQTIITTLLFKKIPSDLPVSNKLQVDGVSTATEYRAKFLTGRLYLILIARGFTVISDDYQFRGGEGLWKSLARKADKEGCIVRIWDERTENWIKDKNGQPLRYTADNLSDDAIWNDKNADKTTLFVLSKNQS